MFGGKICLGGAWCPKEETGSHCANGMTAAGLFFPLARFKCRKVVETIRLGAANFCLTKHLI